MSALLASIGFVVLAEMGDKTQLLAMALACRFRWHGTEGTVRKCSAEFSGNQRPPRPEPDLNVRLAKLFADFVQYPGDHLFKCYGPSPGRFRGLPSPYFAQSGFMHRWLQVTDEEDQLGIQRFSGCL